MDKPLIFCAIDTADIDRAIELARVIGPITQALKLGLEFFNTFGPQGIEKIRQTSPDAALFIDLKFHDIPNTVSGAVKAISERFQPMFLNVHAAGGLDMMKAAREACYSDTKLLAVTILTSLNNKALAKIGYESGETAVCVKRLALLTQESGLDGVVCSAHEIELLREACGPDFSLMVPGIRPEGADLDDQKRVMTPKQALQEGANHLVIGRPITKAADPALAAQKILESIKL